VDRPEEELKTQLPKDPSDVRARTDLGVFYHRSGRLEEAVSEFEQALESAPNDAAVSYNLAAVLCGCGDAEKAVVVLQQALGHSPLDARLHYGSACALQALGQAEDAIGWFQSAIGLNRNDADAWYGLGTAYQAKGDGPGAIYCYERTCGLDPDHPAARHMVNALAGSPSTQPPTGFVRGLFDHYAKNFDQHLVDVLNYRAPELLLDALKPELEGRNDLDVLDLGCGTGLFGTRIRSYASHLSGIDVSSAMLDRAREKSIYDELREIDILDHLSSLATGSFDLISAVDVLTYLGALEGVIAGARKVLRPGGLLAFTVEEEDGDGYSLSGTGRYRHSPAYLDRLRKEHGFGERALTEATLRMEGKAPCEGLVVVWSII
jgi:predicted TPR repeat methyltransferase